MMNYYTPEQMAAWKANITDAADAADYVATMQEMRIVWAVEEEMEEEAAAERAEREAERRAWYRDAYDF